MPRRGPEPWRFFGDPPRWQATICFNEICPGATHLKRSSKARIFFLAHAAGIIKAKQVRVSHFKLQ